MRDIRTKALHYEHEMLLLGQKFANEILVETAMKRIAQQFDFLAASTDS